MNGNSAEEQVAALPKNGSHRFHHAYTGVPDGECECCRKEKPWQRVLTNFHRRGSHLYKPVKSVPSYWLLVVLGILLLLAFFTQLIDDDLPSVISQDSAGRSFDRFSEEKALGYLKIITGDQPRVSGTPYHLQKTKDLKELLDNVARDALQTVYTDWQSASGEYWLSYTSPHVNSYYNASNVAALLIGESGAGGQAILVNCHYDSVPFALGTSDDALFCAVMVETLSLLSRRDRKLKHNIIFLFNGAEENPLQGSHAFLQHPWFRSVTAVVNLDAAGMNGKSNLFQVTDPRILSAYRQSVSRPSAQAMGEILFQSGIVPSDTDFRIWRDFGQVYGVDIAFVKWGQVYHTRYDSPEFLQAGALQHAGDMLLALISTVGDIPEMGEKAEPTTAVYWDFLYMFMASYSFTAAYVIDAFTLLFAIFSVVHYLWTVGFRWLIVRELLHSILGRIYSIVIGSLITMMFMWFMGMTTRQMRYLTHPWIVVPMYWIPYLIIAVCTAHVCDKWREMKGGLNRIIRVAQAMCATRILVSLVVLVLLCIPNTATLRYVFTVPLLLMSKNAMLSLTLIRLFRLKAWYHLVIECVLATPPTLFLISLALRINALILPVMGRSMNDNPDYTIGQINLILAIMVPMALSGIELSFSRRFLWICSLALGAITLVLMVWPFSVYSIHGPATQRHYWFHTDIVTYDYYGSVVERQHGVLITKHDAYTPNSVLPVLEENKLNYRYRTNFSEDCQRYVYCNLPLYRTRFGEYLGSSILLYTGPPRQFTPAPSVSLLGKHCVGITCTYHITMTGPAHNMLTIWPRQDVNLTSWSFNVPLTATLSHNGRPVYVVVHNTATYMERFVPLNVTLNFVIPESLQSQPVVDISHHAHKIQDPQDNTAEFNNLVDAMPEYYNMATTLTIRSNYVF